MADSMTVAELAKELRVQPKKLLPLLLKEYVKIVEPNEDLGSVIIERPLPEVLEWLRMIYRSPSLQPTIPVKYAAHALTLAPAVVRRLCEKHGIQVYKDSVFGYLISARAFHSLCRLWAELYQPLRTDLQALVYNLAKLYGHKTSFQPRPFDKRLEDEITRIVHMDEPDRTLAATLFWVNYNKAKIATEAIAGPKPTSTAQYRIQILNSRMKALSLALEGKCTWKNPRTFGDPSTTRSRMRAASNAKYAARNAAPLDGASLSDDRSPENTTSDCDFLPSDPHSETIDDCQSDS